MSFFRRAKPSSLRSLLSSRLSKPPSPPHRDAPSLYPPFSRLFSTVTTITRSNKHFCQQNPLFQGFKRSYYVDGRQVQHFRRRAAGWYRNPRTAFLVVVISGGVIISVYYGHLETVPYTKRKHFVLLSPEMERQLGEHQFEQLKKSLRGKILSAIHPESIRVRLISKEIVDAVKRGLQLHEKKWSDAELSQAPAAYGGEVPVGAKDVLMPLRGYDGRVGGVESWRNEDEIIDDDWVHQSRTKAAKGRSKAEPNTEHLKGLNWEVLVVKDDMVNAFCLPGGKIVVFTGLLDHFRTDPEIATVIGHEVGHAIARHSAEMITKNMWLMIIQLVLLQFFGMPDLVNALSNLLLRLPFSRKMEIEADYVGLLLLASAGYDPRIAPKVYEKLGQINKDSTLNDYLSTHPSSKKRAQLLSQAQVMEEALTIYRETVEGHGVAGFL